MERFHPKRTRLPGALLITACLGIAVSHERAAGSNYADWLARQETVRRADGLLRYYPLAEAPGPVIRNQAPAFVGGDLAVRTNEAYADPFFVPPADYPDWTEGRWPEKSALAIGTASDVLPGARFHGPAGTDFALEVWVRTHALPEKKLSCSLLSVGNAWSDGWRLSATWYSTEFCLGRPPAPAGREKEPGFGPVSANGPALAPQVWHHVVALLRDKELELYVDGARIARKEFDGIYQHQAQSTQPPELDFGGMRVGPFGNREGNGRFDLDELAVFGRALTAEEIQARWQAGKSALSPEEQKARFKAAEERRNALTGLRLDLPHDTRGYFPVHQPIPIALNVESAESATLVGRDGKVRFTVRELGGKTVTQWEQPLRAHRARARITASFTPTRCGLFFLDAAVTGSDGKDVKRLSLPFAVRVALPESPAELARLPLASYVGHLTETCALGARMERTIAPIWRRLPDGTMDLEHSDNVVAQCLNQGLDILYCIQSVLPKAGQPAPNWEQLAKDPTEWADLVRTLVTRYKGQVKYWEIVNEPNSGHHTNPVNKMTPENYVAALKVAHQIIHEVDPAAKVSGPCGTANWVDWTEAVLAAGGGEYLDILTYHNYLGTSPIAVWRDQRPFPRLQAAMDRYLKRPLPLWNSECGIHQPTRNGELPLTGDELFAQYANRARKTPVGVTVGVDAIMMTDEHTSACWQAQSLLMEMAAGMEKYFLLMRASGTYPSMAGAGTCHGGGLIGIGNPPVIGYPTKKGLALATLQAALAGWQKVETFPTGLSDAAALLVTHAGNRRTLALFADSAQLLPLAGFAPDQIVRGMDMVGNPLELKANAAGTLTPALAPELLYLQDVPAKVTVADTVQVAAFPERVEPSSRVAGKLTVRNPFSTKLKAAVVIETKAGKVEMAGAVALGAKKTVDVPFVLATDALYRGTHRFRARLVADGQTLGHIERTFLSEGLAIPVKRLAATPKLAGDAALWEKIPAVKAETPERIFIGRPLPGAPNAAWWRDAKDLSYAMRWGWTPDGIFFRLEVTDDVVRPPKNEAEQACPWIYDCVELFVDVRPLAEQAPRLTPGAFQFGIVPTAGDTPAACKVVPCGKNPPVELTAVGHRTATGYVVEGRMALPTGSPFKLEPGTRLGLDLAVDDNDDNAYGRRVQMLLHGNEKNCMDTSGWGRYRLE